MSGEQAADARRHYDDVDVHRFELAERARLPTIGVRRLHNWLKEQQCQIHVSRNDTILDVCAGKGGDLDKFARAGVSAVVLLDTSRPSLQEAQRRLSSTSRSVHLRTHAQFIAADAFDSRIWNSGRLERALLTAVNGTDHRERATIRVRGRAKFGAASCQFALHYAFSSEERVVAALRGVARHLRTGGYFFGIMANGDAIERRLSATDDACISAELYTIDARDSNVPLSSEFGASYRFSMADRSVVNVTEYVVHERVFRRLAEQEGFAVHYYTSLPSLYAARRSTTQRAPNADRSTLDVAKLYIAFALRLVNRNAARTGSKSTPNDHPTRTTVARPE